MRLLTLPRRLLRWLRPPRRLKFTREGRYFVAITIGIGLAAINTGNNLLYLLLGWLLSLIVASGVLSELAMRGLKIRRAPPQHIHANRPFLMDISVENKKRRLASYSIEVEDLLNGSPIDKKCYFLKIPAGRTQRTSYRHTFHRRGRYTFTGFRLATRFPFALFRKSRDVAESGEAIVFPEVKPVTVPAPIARQQGETLAAQLGRRGEFFGLREYRDGDDRHDIHWRSTARTGRLLVREYEQESHRRATILCDNSLPEHASNDAKRALEEAIILAASLAQAYLRKAYSVRLIARGVGVPFAPGEAQLLRILRTLALLDTVSDDVPFSSAVDRRADSVLVVPRGVGSSGRPTQIGHVMEAG